MRAAPVLFVTIAALTLTSAGLSPAHPGAATLDSKLVHPLEGRFWAVLEARHCAVRGAPSPSELSALNLEAEESLARARSAGLGPALVRTERKWADFQIRAEWDCPPNSGPGAYRAAIGAFDRELDQMLGKAP